jgi:hypothetical protein
MSQTIRSHVTAISHTTLRSVTCHNPIASHRIPSHPNASQRIPSHPNASQRIPTFILIFSHFNSHATPSIFFSFLQHSIWEIFITIINSTIFKYWGIAGLMRPSSWSIQILIWPHVTTPGHMSALSHATIALSHATIALSHATIALSHAAIAVSHATIALSHVTIAVSHATLH